MTAHQIRQVAVLAFADPRTVTKYLAGKLREGSIAYERIDAAVRQLRADNSGDQP